MDALTYAGCLGNVISVAEHSNYSFEHVNIVNREALDDVFSRIYQTR